MRGQMPCQLLAYKSHGLGVSACPGYCANPLCVPWLSDAESASVVASPSHGSSYSSQTLLRLEPQPAGKAVSLELQCPQAAVSCSWEECKTCCWLLPCLGCTLACYVLLSLSHWVSHLSEFAKACVEWVIWMYWHFHNNLLESWCLGS